MNLQTNRYAWLDFMKVFGMWLIIAGHFTPPYYEILYVFSVQLFFIISGFLFRNTDNKTFFKKLYRQLVVPMLLLALAYLSINLVKDFYKNEYSINNVSQSILDILIGDTNSLGALWFVYTLILSKIISQFSHKTAKFIIFLICLLGAWIYNKYSNLTLHSSLINVLLAYPMFYIGEVVSQYALQINNYNNRKTLYVTTILCLGVITICFLFNDTVWMYRGIYGSSLLLFIIGSVAGTITIFAISKLFFNKRSELIYTLSEGTILILAFHIHFVILGLRHPVGYFFYFESFIILIAFYPIIKLCEKHAPILLGFRGLCNYEGGG